MPHGPENAAIMLLSEAPTLEDFAAGQPIGGESWELAEADARRDQIPADQAYSASLSCFHVPGARMSPADRAACAEIARKHIRLARPKRLLLLGDGRPRRCSANRCRRRAAMLTRSKACGPSPPSIRAS